MLGESLGRPRGPRLGSGTVAVPGMRPVSGAWVSASHGKELTVETLQLIGALLGLVGIPVWFASILDRHPDAPWTQWRLPWRQQDWYMPRGFRLMIVGESLWTIGALTWFLPFVLRKLR
jgi:hypothetical protein